MDVVALTELRANTPEVYDQLAFEMKGRGMQNVTPKSMAEAVYNCSLFPDENNGFPLKDGVNAVIAEAEKIIWASENRDRLIRIRAQLRYIRLANRMGNERHQRSYDHLALLLVKAK